MTRLDLRESSAIRSVSRRRLDVLAVTTVTGTPSCSARDGRSRRSRCDTRAGIIETITSSHQTLEGLAHRDERVGVGDDAFYMPVRRLLQQRDGELQGQRPLLCLGSR